MTIRTNPSLGPGMDQVIGAGDAWFDYDADVSPQYGDVAFDGDGCKRIWTTSAAALTIGSPIAIDDNGNASGTTSGAYVAPVAISPGDSFWAKASTK